MDTNIKQEIISSGEVISLSSSSSSSGDFSDVEVNPKMKKQRMEAVLPVGFLDPIRPAPLTVATLTPSCRQFWKAGDYDGSPHAQKFSDEDMDHLRVHPKFLHSNATCHKWALGAFAELLDNALDENCNGATYVHVDVLRNKKNKSQMVVVQDNGGGMAPDKMRQCMSLGYSVKSKEANTIGQYGNGFKTSTMRLGADVIVFSRCHGKHGGRSTQSIGLLSFTFLRCTGKEDIVVPMIDYVRKEKAWIKYVKSNSECWQRNLETIIQWSPYESEEDLLQQFEFLKEQGTRIIIYNLWEDEEGSPELDFDTDKLDIQIRGDNKDQKKIDLAKKYPSCSHFLTYRHSLRTYASILYRRIPVGFRIMLRGKDVDHYNMADDLIHSNELMYKPAAYADAKDPNMSAKVKLGFVKDAVHHIDIQGFNVYHKNRLIKPFWRVWSAAGSDGRGVIGVLEANFVEPSHDKQGFERTITLSRLEARLQHFQKIYWSSNCHLIGYSERRSHAKKAAAASSSSSPEKEAPSPKKSDAKMRSSAAAATLKNIIPPPELACPLNQSPTLNLQPENNSLRLRLKNALQDVQYEKDKNKKLENQIEDLKKMMVTMDQEQEMFVSVFSEERGRRERDEENLRIRLKEASETIQALLDKVKRLEAARN
ncbi:hypothetical protein ACS0TY_010949 [Phlomoides rotata]